MCVGDSIHLLSNFYRRFDVGEDKTEALFGTLEHTGIALLFTSLTTSVGLASFATSNLAMTANLGIYAAIGTMFAFILTVILLPCFIILLPLKRQPAKHRGSIAFARIVDLCTHLASRHTRGICCMGVALFVASIYFAMQLGLNQNSLEWFPLNHPTRIAMVKIQDRMGGMVPIEVVIDTGKPGGANDPTLLQKLDDSLNQIKQWHYEGYRISKTMGLNEIIKEIHQALNNNDDSFYIIPQTQASIRQELLLVEMDAADDLFRFTDPDFRYLRSTILIPMGSSMQYRQLIIDKIEAHFSEHYPNVTVDYTGLGVLMGQVVLEMIQTIASSYLLAIIVISILMILFLGDLRIGLISMVPNLLPIAMVLAYMQLRGLSLDAMTLMIGSIALGISVDDTVHFMHHFKRFYRDHGDASYAVSQTLHTTGRALAVTTLVLSLGFLTYTQAMLSNMQNFGLLTALCITLALIADFILAPALLVLMFPSETVISQEVKALPAPSLLYGAQVGGDRQLHQQLVGAQGIVEGVESEPA